MQSEEKRQYRRFRHSEPLECQFTDPAQFGGALSCDLSSGGLKMKFREFIPLGTEMAVNIPTGKNAVVECRGTVVRISRMPLTDWYEVGLKFNEEASGRMVRQKIEEVLDNEASGKNLKGVN